MEKSTQQPSPANFIEVHPGIRLGLVNTTTALPFDCELQQKLASILTQCFAFSWSAPWELTALDIFFVEESDPDLRAYEISEHGGCDIDLLGVYLGTSGYRRPIIKVSPERVLNAARTFKLKSSRSEALTTLYPLLLTAVIVHELAHALMDRGRRVADTRSSWKCAACEPTLYRRGATTEPDDPIRSTAFYRVVEESLAQAYVYIQGFDQYERNVILAFMSASPAPYNTVDRWNLSDPDAPGKLVRIMASWRDYKALDGVATIRCLQSEWKGKMPAELLAQQLLTRGAPLLHPQTDFRAEFAETLRTAMDSPLVTGDFELLDELGRHLLFMDRGDTVQQNADLRLWKSTQSPNVPATIPADYPVLSGKAEITSWLRRMGIRRFEIVGSTVSVDGDVDLSSKGLHYLPVKFGKVRGTFDCSHNYLTTMKGFPAHVRSDLDCSNNEIESLDADAIKCDGNVLLGRNDISSLIGVSDRITSVGKSLFLCDSLITRGGIGLMMIDGIKSACFTTCPESPSDTIKNYIGRPDCVFDCQARLIEDGFEEFAKP